MAVTVLEERLRRQLRRVRRDGEALGMERGMALGMERALAGSRICCAAWRRGSSAPTRAPASPISWPGSATWASSSGSATGSWTARPVRN